MKLSSMSAYGLLLTAATLSLCLPARAAERITLRNGFTIDCDHHVAVKNKLRLYLNKTEESYIELPQDDLVAAEVLPDRPPSQPEKNTTVEAPATPAQTKSTGKGTRLNSQLNTADLHEILVRESAEHNVDVDLLASIVKAESGGNANAVSHAGAQGLMQLMPSTAASHGVDNSFAPEQNVHGGSAYINELLTRYHDNLALALAAYNAGPAAVDKYKGIPPYAETRAYVAHVIHEFNRRVRAREALSLQGSKPLN
jgi:hypothetical protein